MQTIAAPVLFEKMKNGQRVDLLDVRTPVEYRELHAEGAQFVPLDQLDPQAVMAGSNGRASEPLYVICSV